MTDLILCNRLPSLKARLKGISGPIRFISLLESRESLQISDYLASLPNALDISSTGVFNELSAGFKSKFVDFMGEINGNNYSLDWWAMPFTDKFPLATDISRNTFYFLLITRLITSNSEPLVVICDSREMAAQVKEWAKERDVKVADAIATPRPLRRFVKHYTPAGIAYAFLRTLVYWMLSRRYRPAPNLSEDHVVVNSLTHPDSFPSGPVGYRDVYFGRLVEELAASKSKALVFAEVLWAPVQQLKKLRSIRFDLPVIPMESCLTFRSLMECTFLSLRLFARPVRLHGPMMIEGQDLSCLVEQAVRGTRRSGNLFMNLKLYYCARELARRLRVSRWLYPYENMSREKMLLLGVRSSSPQTHMLGYQHAAISSSLTNFALSLEESKITPLPDVVLTTGELIRDRLEREGNFPPGILKTACALRQVNPISNERRDERQEFSRVLVALGSIVEYVSMLVFLEKALGGENRYQIRIRPHPERTLESALEVAPLSRVDFFSKSPGALDEDLLWADVVLFASSSVSLAAISAGIPLIYVDLGNILDTDPLPGWSEFKWSVKEPSELAPILQHIEVLPNDEYQHRQEKGKKYASSYMAPVTPERLRVFLEA